MPKLGRNSEREQLAWAVLTSILFVLAGQDVALAQRINTPVIPDDKDKFRVGPLTLAINETTHFRDVHIRREGGGSVKLHFADQPPIELVLRDSSTASVAAGVHYDNQGTDVIGPFNFLCEAFYALIPYSDKKEKEYAGREPYSAPTNRGMFRFWSPAFVYVVSTRQMNGLFSQVLTQWELEIRDKNNALRERWEPRKTVGERLPRYDGNEVYPLQWRIKKFEANAKVTAMMMFDLPMQPEVVALGKGPITRVLPSSVDLNVDDTVTTKVEFATYARVDSDKDDAADKTIFRMDFGFELVVAAGQVSSAASIKVTGKTVGDPPVAIPSRVKITPFPAAGEDAGLGPAEEAEKNDPGPPDKSGKGKIGWGSPGAGAVEKTAP
ncbi:MAG: hypothetical protein HYY17_03715 [Planctomycetes bacterium]|nr:hypothetical protein [Planctomycetota bacterium]